LAWRLHPSGVFFIVSTAFGDDKAMNMDKNTRWVFLGWATMGLLIAWVLGEGTRSLLHTLSKHYNVNDFQILGEAFTMGNLIGVVFTLIVSVVLWKNEKINSSAHEVVEELQKVTWPDAKDTQTSTIVVIITTIIFSLILAVYDILWRFVTAAVYG
jgi:preprotein translocase SecE subunit